MKKIDLHKGECLDMVVVSLFDGLSGGRIALDRTPRLNVLRYYSSEVDKYAIQVADKNYPQDMPYRLGSVVDVDGHSLLSEIRKQFVDVKILLIGGSPCQGFSMAGKLKGSSTKCGQDVVTLAQYLNLKEQGFEFDGQSYLFWEYIRIKQELNPDYFMLENVRITKKWLPMFNEAMGVEPTRINSSLLSAQNRDRYYWHNFGEIPQPDDKKLLLRDILDYSVEDTLKLQDNKKIVKLDSHHSNSGIKCAAGIAGTKQCLDDGKKLQRNFSQGERIYSTNAKAITLSSQSGGTSGQGSMIIERPCKLKDFNENSTCHHIADATDIKGNESIKRVYAESGKSPAITTCQGGHREQKVLVNKSVDKEGNAYCVTARYNGAVAWNSCERKQRTMVITESSEEKHPNVYNGAKYRKLTPLECERLQTLPDFFTSKGLEIRCQSLYNGNECNIKDIKCQKPAKSKNVISPSQVGKLNSAINTILDNLDMEQRKLLENLSIKVKGVLSMDAKENNKQLKVCVSSIINHGKENSLLMKAKNVRYVISQSEVGQMECVLSIISNNKETETLYRMKQESTSLLETEESIINTKMVDGLIGELQKKLLEENSKKEKLYIILTLINSITALAILKSSQTQSISLCIDSSNLLQENLLEMDLLNLKTVNIVDVSNSSRYKMIGNGWTIDVVAHILSFIAKNRIEDTVVEKGLFDE